MPETANLADWALKIRRLALTLIYEARSGHPGGSLSSADILSVLYFHVLRLDPANPRWENRDRFILSKGHVCPALYAALILRGYMTREQAGALRSQGSLLQGHPDMKRCPGIDISTGSLGQGFSCGAGMALAAKRDDRPYRAYILVGDGECNEGQIWEAAQFAAKYQLDNCFVLVDHNRLQNDGPTRDIMPSGDLTARFRAFGFDAASVDGHDTDRLLKDICALQGRRDGRPKCLVCNTIKGKGVSFMENVPEWHGKAPDEREFRLAMEELGGAWTW